MKTKQKVSNRLGSTINQALRAIQTGSDSGDVLERTPTPDGIGYRCYTVREVELLLSAKNLE